MQVVIDTNILIRYFTNDSPQKAELVEQLLLSDEDIFIPDVVFPELEYILVKEYKFSKDKVLEIIKFLSSQANITVTSEIRKAIRIFEKTKLDMADCIIASYSLKGKLASFDKELLGVEGAHSFWK